MENNSENKLKFFAQYFGQRVLKRNLILSNRVYIIDWQEFFNISMSPENYHLELRSIESITDAECLMLYRLLIKSMTFGKYYQNLIENEKKIYSIRFRFLFAKRESLTLQQIEIDFLRSKGFLVPFMNLTTDQILEFGWAKIKDNEQTKAE